MLRAGVYFFHSRSRRVVMTYLVLPGYLNRFAMGAVACFTSFSRVGTVDNAV